MQCGYYISPSHASACGILLRRVLIEAAAWGLFVMVAPAVVSGDLMLLWRRECEFTDVCQLFSVDGWMMLSR